MIAKLLMSFSKLSTMLAVACFTLGLLSSNVSRADSGSAPVAIYSCSRTLINPNCVDYSCLFYDYCVAIKGNTYCTCVD